MSESCLSIFPSEDGKTYSVYVTNGLKSLGVEYSYEELPKLIYVLGELKEKLEDRREKNKV